MNCEQIEEWLSAYLDNMLASDERREISIHLQGCSRCMRSLAELRQNDILIARLPRIAPHPALRERLFALSQVLEITGTGLDHLNVADEWTRPLGPRQLSGRSRISRPRLVALSAGQPTLMDTARIPATPPTIVLHPFPPVSQPKKTRRPLWKFAAVAMIVLTLSTVGLLSFIMRQTAPPAASLSNVVTPPAAGPAAGPLAAGTRFVFLRDGALWSALADHTSPHLSDRLTPGTARVAAGWVVSPTLAGHTAGNMLAYLDLLSATIHTIRSDGQQDSSIPQLLLPRGTSPASVWETMAGQSILSGLTWSKDGRLLAFVADPAGDGQTGLYLYSLETGKVRRISLDLKGSVSHPVWSPDSARLAFEFIHDGRASVLDYNVQNQGVLDLSNLDASSGNNANSILSLNWLPSVSSPAVTWSLGQAGHINSLWVHYVGASGTTYPQLLSNGSYSQAIYSPGGADGVGSWLVIARLGEQVGDISCIDLKPDAQMLLLSRGKQVSFARWAPDGSAIFYMGHLANGVGSGYIVNVPTGITYSVAGDIAASPAPTWSVDSHQLAYSTASRVKLFNAQKGRSAGQLPLQGVATSLVWSPTVAHQLVVSLEGSTSGIYLVDVTNNASQQLDHLSADNPIQWTEIP